MFPGRERTSKKKREGREIGKVCTMGKESLEEMTEKYKYQFILNYEFIGKPFPALGIENAVEIILKRHFKGYNPVIKYSNILREEASIIIPIPGRKKLRYGVMKTGLKVMV
jgi:hypothetical protein